MITHLPDILSEASPSARKEFKRHALLKRVERGEQITFEGDSCHYFPIVESGVIRVYKIGSGGQEVTLYRINQGEGCVLTMTCVLKTAPFPAYAAAEQRTMLYMVPANVFRAWTGRHEFWRDFVLTHMTRVITDVIGRVEEVAFRNVEMRIAEFVVREAIARNTILHRTHQQIAQEIGSAREVVSRTLKQFERDNIVQLDRGKITVTDIARLQKRAVLL